MLKIFLFVFVMMGSSIQANPWANTVVATTGISTSLAAIPMFYNAATIFHLIPIVVSLVGLGRLIYSNYVIAKADA